jgi:phosphatidylglycerol:prolipoprotein diacylglycerol transferase
LLNYPEINNIAVQIGPIKLYWYGISYLIGFALAWYLAKIRARNLYHWNSDTISDFIFYCAIGAVVGGHLGYILFYDLKELFHDPWFIFKTWHGGMAFHGGLLGVVISLLFFARKMKLPFIEMIDFAAPLTPLGLGLGRIGNFINSELWGRVTTVPWGMMSEKGGPLPRHPSQLYQAFAEGIVLFIIVWFYSSKSRPRGTISGLFLCCYGVIRFVCEFFRAPDMQLGFIIANWLTMGQLLSLPMILIGIYMIWFYNK